MKRFFIVLLGLLVVLSACSNGVDGTSSVLSECAISSDGSSEEPISSDAGISPVSSNETVSEEPKPFTPISSVDDYFKVKVFSIGDSASEVKYLFHEPIRDHGEKRPLVIFLHGLGDSVSKSGLGTADPLVKSLIKLENESEKYGTYTLVPMTPLADEGWWTSMQLEAFKSLIKNLVKDYDIDSCRVYISGISMGGMVTCQLINEMMPYSFAAAVPMSGANNLKHPDMLHDTAFRIYHSALDDVVDVSQSRNLAKQLMDSGHKNVGYVEFPEGGHVSPIYKVFRDDCKGFFDWLFEQKLPHSTLTMPF